MGGATASLDFQLAPAEAKTGITVTGAVGAVRADMPQLGDRLGDFQVNETHAEFRESSRHQSGRCVYEPKPVHNEWHGPIKPQSGYPDTPPVRGQGS